jgi:NifU-like protein
VTNYCKAGGGCGGCVGEIEQIIIRVRKEIDAAAEKESVRPKKLTNIEKIKLIGETIEREIRPTLKRDNGDIELIDVDGDNVIVALRGMCANCAVAQFTLKDVVEAKLREFVTPELVVVEAKE